MMSTFLNPHGLPNARFNYSMRPLTPTEYRLDLLPLGGVNLLQFLVSAF